VTTAEKLVVRGYRITVTNSEGSVVYRRQERMEEPNFFKRMFTSVFWKRKDALEFPEQITWEAVDNDGEAVPEGAYTFRLLAWDDKGNRGSSPEIPVVVDNTPPQATVQTPYTIFSPNNDGNKDILVFEQEGSAEPEWTGRIVDEAGSTVREFTWDEGPPENFVWDGRNDADAVVPDGTYRYRLAATDRAGNAFQERVTGITVDTRDTPIDLSISRSYFSPDGDGTGDTIEFRPEVPVTEGIASWEFRILDSAGSTRFSYESEGEIPPSYTFDGELRDGTKLSEGRYRARFSVLYTNGNNPTARSPEFTLDVTDPEVSVSADREIFSPNGDGNKETVTFRQSTSSEVLWTGVISTTGGSVVRRFQWREEAPEEVVWNGRDGQGSPVSDGEYRYSLFARDQAGNYSEASTASFVKDTRLTPIELSLGTNAFSPNGDGSKDELRVEPNVEDPEGLLEVSYRIETADGRLVRELQRSEEPYGFTWNGRNDSGNRVSDGEYRVRLVGRYANGNRPRAEAGPVSVDTVFPSAELTVPYEVFSPDGDGSQDTLPIEHSDATEEESWNAEIVNDDGETVRSFSWSGTPEDLTWRGRDAAGNRIPDGSYSYVLSSTDAAGNEASFRISDIRVDTRPTPVAVKIGRAAFSPNGDGVADSLDVSVELEVTDLIAEWRVRIVDAGGTTHRVFRGTGSAPSEIEFDGRDDEGDIVPEGEYRAVATVRYEAGSEPTARSPEFDVDVTAPDARISSDVDLFSPNGDGRKDTVTISQSVDDGAEWRGTVRNAEGELVRSERWQGEPPERFVWDGRNDAGNVVANGSYRYVLSGTDRAGNSTETEAVTVRKDTRRRTVQLSTTSTHFSPNDDGVQEDTTVRADVTPAEDVRVREHTFRIEDAEGNRVYQTRRRGGVQATYVWDGRTDDGGVAPDGSYTAELRLEFANGDVVRDRSRAIVLDTEAPQISLEAPYLLFSPNGDDRKDRVVIRQDSSDERLWEGRILNDEGEEIVSEAWEGEAERFTWNGKDQYGNSIPDGAYTYVVSATDRAGNSVRRELGPIRVDTQVTSLYASFARSSFSPDGDGYRDSVEINLYANPNDEIERWSLDIRDENGHTIRSFGEEDGATVPQSVTWNGRDAGGAVQDGRYTAVLEAVYRKGDRPSSETESTLLLDTSGPSFDIAAGPTPFSPDNDGQADTLSIRFQEVSDASSIESWRVDVLDPKGNRFYRFEGDGTPPDRVTWDGRSASGELVQAATEYTLETTLTDSLRNARTVETTVPIDVLVIKDGDQYKIRISSINFAPNTAEFTGISPEQDQRNRETLDRLAEILKTYEDYRIRVEGHANNVTGTQREEREELKPLSRDRAQAIKQALVERGIEASRMETVGMGGTEPVVPRSDREDWWKNRRVEFILIRDS
jgi:flagellar hook assembly protein FlgD/outer membrane protein OmpA-like peptidoglycan-associated protein